MKKTLLILISAVAVTAVYGQGGFTLDNFYSGNLTTIAIQGSGSPPASINPGNSGDLLGNEYSFAFIWGNGTLNNSSLLVNSWTGDTGDPTPVFGDPGDLTGPVQTGDQGYFYDPNEVWLNTASSTITIEILAWYNGGGTYTTFAQAAAAGVNTGVSGLITGVGLVFGVQSTPTDAYNVPAFTVQSPEPSTMVLAGLGAAAMLLFRRRQS